MPQSDELSDLVLEEELGLVVFEDGSSSRGPSVLGGGDGGEDDIPEAPFLETPLVDKGRTRVRGATRRVSFALLLMVRRAEPRRSGRPPG